jgi:hypothetical protein
MSHDQQIALQMFKDGSRGIWGLTGPSQAATRQTIMRLLTGAKLPQAKCGINALTVEVRKLDPTISRY